MGGLLVNGLNRLEGIFSRIGPGGKPSCKPFRLHLRARPRGKLLYCKGNPASTGSAENPFQTPKLVLVCTGFAVRADFTGCPTATFPEPEGPFKPPEFHSPAGDPYLNFLSTRFPLLTTLNTCRKGGRSASLRHRHGEPFFQPAANPCWERQGRSALRFQQPGTCHTA